MIEGTLVNLRAREATDAENTARWSSDRNLQRLMGNRYQESFTATEATVREYVAQPLSFDNPRFAIETKDGRHIGGLRLFNTSAEDRRARFAILIGDPEYQSRLYGSDALRSLMRFVFNDMNLNRLDLDVFAFNTRAIAVYRKLGFVEEGRRRAAQYARGISHDVVVMSMLQSDWLAMPNA